MLVAVTVEGWGEEFDCCLFFFLRFDLQISVNIRTFLENKDFCLLCIIQTPTEYLPVLTGQSQRFPSTYHNAVS